MGLFGDSRFVDLGLSVRWAKCNIGASAPHELGGLYAWGETQTKSAYRKDTYKFYKEKGFDNGTYVKYRIFDSLESEDDVAHRIMGSKVRIPTATEWGELFDYDKILRKPAYINGRCGVLFTSQIKGYTNNSLFIPFAGCVGGIKNADCSVVRGSQDEYGYYWTRNPGCDYVEDARVAYLYKPCGAYISENSRWRGFSIRAVKEK